MERISMSARFSRSDKTQEGSAGSVGLETPLLENTEMHIIFLSIVTTPFFSEQLQFFKLQN